MELVTLVLLTIVVVLAAILFRQSTTRGSVDRADMESLRAEMRESLTQVQNIVQLQVGGLRQEVSTRLDTTGMTMSQVQTRLGELSETTKHIQEISRDISSLQDILQPPKLRGEIGELFLEAVVEQVLPAAAYSTQHRFRDGKTVDMVIHLGQERMVAIDSKFPLESFKRILEAPDGPERVAREREFARTLRQHVDAVAQYIRPGEGTLDYALMYVPAENVYYQVMLKSEPGTADILGYALGKKVYPVSPTSFHAHLTLIAQGLRGQMVEQGAKQILDHLGDLTQHFDGLQRDFSVLGRHITDTNNKFADTRRRLDRFGDALQVLPTGAQLPPSEDLAQLPAPTVTDR